MLKKLLIALTFISISSVSFYSQANAGRYHGSFKDWNVFTLSQNDSLYCYMVSSTIDRAGNYKRRGEPYLLVTARKNGPTEVSISSGYPYKEGSNVEVSIDSEKYWELFTTDETPKIGWAKDSSEDKALLASMKKGFKLRAKGNSRLGTHSIDTYSLNGFTKAMAKVKDLCS